VIGFHRNDFTEDSIFLLKSPSSFFSSSSFLNTRINCGWPFSNLPYQACLISKSVQLWIPLPSHFKYTNIVTSILWPKAIQTTSADALCEFAGWTLDKPPPSQVPEAGSWDRISKGPNTSLWICREPLWLTSTITTVYAVVTLLSNSKSQVPRQAMPAQRIPLKLLHLNTAANSCPPFQSSMISISGILLIAPAAEWITSLMSFSSASGSRSQELFPYPVRLTHFPK
jgi:hypothetical protein